ncbi:acetolactate synthase catalytic subunit [Arthrobacter sp. MI7-26]|uniref:acetolactate synthase catalytic subunit n=1 Tax=Arthrobacter sp. MI7-26 TaxID=2993653 RepID=UPI0022499528|nr:acetolactate synthase catalytic subunit [Arthrobacter sp. MI7-26]MCX2748070.1 acetolactate synthase catalytic subunit [Arthrobacter sp. MI7-26]
MSSTVADAIASALKRHGITTIFGQSNPTALLLAAERIGIRQIFYRTENAGGVMADGFSRISGRVGVVAAQNGPAATLFVAPMAEAMKASIPMVVFVQEVPAANRDRNAFQELDHVSLFSGVSKWTRRIDDPARAVDYVDMAITAANSGRPGPVVLLVPKDVLDLPAEESRFGRTDDLGTFPLDRPRPSREVIEEAAQLLASARSPIVIAGGGVHISGATLELAELQRIGHLPVATTNMGKGAVDETNPLSVGVAANITGRNGPAHHLLPLIQDADVVLLIGTRTNENGTDAWTLTDPEARYIHIDIDPLEIGRNYEALRLVGDVRSTLRELTERLSELDLDDRADAASSLAASIEAGRRLHAQQIDAAATSTASPIAPERVLKELDRLVRPDDIVVADASYASIWVTGYLTARTAGQRFLVPRGLAGLGWGLPLALGAKLASPNSRVIAVVGDGGFAHVWSELETAVREGLPVVVIILNNSILGFQRHAENYAFGTTTTAIEFAPVDHAAIAQASGAVGVRITDPSELSDALKTALASNSPTVLDVIVDPDAYAPVRAWDTREGQLNLPLASREGLDA